MRTWARAAAAAAALHGESVPLRSVSAVPDSSEDGPDAAGDLELGQRRRRRAMRRLGSAVGAWRQMSSTCIAAAPACSSTSIQRLRAQAILARAHWQAVDAHLPEFDPVRDLEGQGAPAAS